MTNPLVGKIAMITDHTNDKYQVFKIVADLGHGFVLADLLDPNTGEQAFSYVAQLVFHLGQLNDFIFDSFADVEAFEDRRNQLPSR